MSTNRAPLRHPGVIAGTAFGLLVVGALNLHTFAPGGRLLGLGGGRADTHLTPPSDLEEVVGDAVRAQRDRSALATAQQNGAGAVVRDPFSGSAPTAPPPTPTAPRAAAPRRSAGQALVCSAVLLGGQTPLAVFGEHAYKPGDRVQGHEIVAIDVEGVHLRGADGRPWVLAVGAEQDATAGFHLVTGPSDDASRGATQLIEPVADGGTKR